MEEQRSEQPVVSVTRQTEPAADETVIRTELLGHTPEQTAKPAEPVQPAQSRAAKELTEWIKALAIAGLLVFVIRWFLVSPFIVDGESMEPNFWNRERIIVNKIIYDIRDPRRGEIIVFHVPDEGRDFIKRVIGLPGDTVRVSGDSLFINGELYDEDYLRQAIAEAQQDGQKLYNVYKGESSNFPNVNFPDGRVPEGTVFVMGDNRANSEDSRMIGFVPMERIVGRADVIFWPLGDIHIVRH